MLEDGSVNVLRGRPDPLGASWDGNGVNFALFSVHAEMVELCLFDAAGMQEQARIQVPHRTGHVWHCFLAGVKPGQAYAYRVHGPYAPQNGQLFNRHKVLLDPYARNLVGDLQWGHGENGSRIAAGGDWEPDCSDSQDAMPKCLVEDPAFDWENDRSPRTAWRDTIIYELHVKGFTQRHPAVPAGLRGTYLGLASDPVISYMRDLGVTAVELLPCQAFVTEPFLHDKGLVNYWGYNPVAFFAPTRRYAIADPVAEFKTLIKKLHAAGLEVILDVVFNHTAEGNHRGPHLSLRGIDNLSYYRLDPGDLRRYLNYSGSGNTLNSEHPQVLKLVMDCLRYWALEMHVDGFRFDLATSLGREKDMFNPDGKFCGIIHQDPLLSRLKLIAEPWDLGHDGYQLGNFPFGWSEWNGRYRDDVRAYWRGEGGMIGAFSDRLAGSSDLFQRNGREPTASINYVSCHDGFTLRDLVSYQTKHNEANLEDNQDGENNNISWNCGVEGSTDDEVIQALRNRQRRNMLATLFLSQGVPMLQAGDEIGRTQHGNNNAYCQDNEVSWIDWDAGTADGALRDFAARLIALRRTQPVLRRSSFLTGEQHDEHDCRDVAWLKPDGAEMESEDWKQSYARCIGMLLGGRILVMFNSYHDEIPFTLPPPGEGKRWKLTFDTSQEQDDRQATRHSSGYRYPLQPRSIALLIECD